MVVIMYIADAAALFMFTDGFKRVHEVLVFDEGHRSWFIDNTVLAGLSCYFLTHLHQL